MLLRCGLDASDVKIGGYCIVVLGQFQSGLALFYVYLLFLCGTFAQVFLYRSLYGAVKLNSMLHLGVLLYI